MLGDGVRELPQLEVMAAGWLHCQEGVELGETGSQCPCASWRYSHHVQCNVCDRYDVNSHLQCVSAHSLESNTSSEEGQQRGQQEQEVGWELMRQVMMEQGVMRWVICLIPVPSKRSGMVHPLHLQGCTERSCKS